MSLSPRSCAFLTLEDRTGFVIDDELAVPPLEALGWTVEEIPWDRPGVPWDDFDVVVLRSAWDYQKDPAKFLAVLGEINRSRARLLNSLALVRWNLEKTYLRGLEAAGVAIVPTRWRDRLEPGDLEGLFQEMVREGTEEIVLKPVVSANADGAFRLDHRTVRTRAAEVEAYYAQLPLMAQPFAREVLTHGEASLFFFDGRYSHAVRKVPKPRDFRSQEEHGSEVTPLQASEPLRRAGEHAVSLLPELPLYARADFVPANDGSGPWLMELEVIEPALYFRMDPASSERFARAMAKQWKRRLRNRDLSDLSGS